MNITEISKKDGKTVVIIFDNGEKLYLSYDIFLKNGLRKNDEISTDRFSAMIAENQLFHIKQKAFGYLGRRHHSAAELRKKLLGKGYDGKMIDEVLADLKIKDYLNDYEFASLYADENIKNKLWGKNKMKAELGKKGISRELISKVIEEKYADGSESEGAIVLGEKKLQSLRKRTSDGKQLRLKLYAYLSSRGYDYDTCREALEKLLKSEDDL